MNARVIQPTLCALAVAGVSLAALAWSGGMGGDRSATSQALPASAGIVRPVRPDRPDRPVRVYLVHRAEHPQQGQSTTSFRDGITLFRRTQGDVWPTVVVGYLEDLEDDWVVLRKAGGERDDQVWIPRERVQLLEHIGEDELQLGLTR